ncbi:hypothetical protein GPX89_02015 [Nocardia sp. ET3-3]|uniref:Uncharacterized protein n=1 Tax=Nocardia terrae TaxID=2675851 RepID=A0A7K1UNW8_9NOCA|nr:hypothetical protein [Nocardia terrae]MVU76017.1 hypothetical protein [Nocardia terrae]
MDIILATTLASLLLFVAILAGRIVDARWHTTPRLTVADIQKRLAAEPPRTYVPISRGW